MKSALIGAVAAVMAVDGTFVTAETTTGAEAAIRQGMVQLGTVVELYTSQGCSACPPADAYLRQLAAQPGVIALALHVDYWDYIGWVDSFGQGRFTERQKAYARAEGSRTIYTPQMIVAGGARVEGVNPDAVAEAVRQDQAAGPGVALRLQRHGSQLTIAAEPREGLTAPVRVQLVRFAPSAQVMIDAGENAGRMVDYTNIVTSWQVIGDWDGKAPLALTTEVPGKDGIVVILQADGPGRIYAAARTD